MLDRLVGADHPAELAALPGVGQCHIERRLRAADLLRGDRRLGRQAQRRRQSAVSANGRPAGDVRQLHPGQLAGLVQRRQRYARNAGGGGVDLREARIVPAHTGDQQPLSGHSIDDEGALTGDSTRRADRHSLRGPGAGAVGRTDGDSTPAGDHLAQVIRRPARDKSSAPITALDR